MSIVGTGLHGPIFYKNWGEDIGGEVSLPRSTTPTVDD